MRCIVCGLTPADVKQHATIGGESFGPACDECTGLAWEGFFVRKTLPDDRYELALVAWLWAKRRAEANGRPFNQPPPERGVEVAA